MPAYGYSRKSLRKRFDSVILGKMARQKQKRPRTYARNRVKRYGEKIYESDSTYFLKLVVFVLLGAIWVKFGQPVSLGAIPIGAVPVGMLLGLILVRRYERHQSDRKIWYAILLIVSIISNFTASGIVI